MPYFTYILRCNDNTFYTGITPDIKRRIKQHNGLLKGGAKYTHSRMPVRLVHTEECATKSEAMQREAAIKKLTRKEKEQLIKKSAF